MCGAPDNVYMGQEVHLYGLTRKQIECFVRCGTPRPPDFILRMDDDEFDMVGLRDTIQTSQLGAWEIQNASSGEETAPSGAKTCCARGCDNAGTKRCSICRAVYGVQLLQGMPEDALEGAQEGVPQDGGVKSAASLNRRDHA